MFPKAMVIWLAGTGGWNLHLLALYKFQKWGLLCCSRSLCKQRYTAFGIDLHNYLLSQRLLESTSQFFSRQVYVLMCSWNSHAIKITVGKSPRGIHFWKLKTFPTNGNSFPNDKREPWDFQGGIRNLSLFLPSRVLAVSHNKETVIISMSLCKARKYLICLTPLVAHCWAIIWIFSLTPIWVVFVLFYHF